MDLRRPNLPEWSLILCPMTHVSVPVLLIAAVDTLVHPPSVLEIVNRVTPFDVISTRYRPEGGFRIALLEIRGSERKELLQSGIILRNANVTVIIANCDKLPVGLVLDLDLGIRRMLDEHKMPRAELLFVGEALDAAVKIDGLQESQ
jgi:hypothetical protein